MVDRNPGQSTRASESTTPRWNALPDRRVEVDMVTHLQAGMRPSPSIGGSDGFPGTDAGSAGTLVRVQDNRVGEGVESSAIENAQPDRCGSGTHPARGGSQSTGGGSPGMMTPWLQVARRNH